jgi:AbrB family looped-hinge helix DNA binding protein
MKATGVVRRIDDLGRIVVPKEIRRTLRIREGDPLLTSLIHSQDLPDTEKNQGLKTRLFMEGISRVAGRVMG